MKIGLFFLGCAALFLIGNVSDVKSQAPAPVAGNGSKVGENFFEMRERANELTRVRDQLNKPEKRKSEASFPKIKKDFEKLQIVNTEKLQKNSIGDKLNYKLISKAAEEINDRALKLKTVLFPEEKPEKALVNMPENLTAGDFQKVIIALDNAIYHFVSSPIFQNTKLVKPEDSQAAQKQLEKVILLSRILESGAGKLSANGK